MPPDFFVLSVEAPEGERFAIVRSEDFLRSATSHPFVMPQPPSMANWESAMERFLRAAVGLLTEDSVRTRLGEMGFGEDAVADHIVRARKVRDFNKGGLWERVTTIGYRNQEGQEVVARTTRVGSEPDQRVFVMRCSVCGHEYGSSGCAIPHRCCPNCQDGPRGEAHR